MSNTVFDAQKPGIVLLLRVCSHLILTTLDSGFAHSSQNGTNVWIAKGE